MIPPELEAYAERHALDPAALYALFERLYAERFMQSMRKTHIESFSGSRTLPESPRPISGVVRALDAERRDDPVSALIEDSGRYRDLGPLGVGGIGEVRRVFDLSLGRTMAMKLLRDVHQDNPTVLARFVEEAQVTAQLQHPGVIPVYELGELSDGRPCFTMQEIRGRNLLQVIAEVHAPDDTASRWSIRRLARVFQRVCETVAYAHELGVIHRDLKPENVMVGPNGEVLIVDWGIAKVSAEPGQGERDLLDEVVTDRHHRDALRTRFGAINGTPAYMAPEQARGQDSLIGPRTDVYGLGAILYEILTGRAPYAGRNVIAVLKQVIEGPPLAVTHEASPPEGLAQLCERAMAREPGERFQSARNLAEAVAAWNEGLDRRERALRLVRDARQHQREAETLEARARASRAQSRRLLQSIPPHAPESEKSPGWALEGQARAQEDAAALEAFEAERLLHGALTHAPELLEAHVALIARYEAEHRQAERAGNRAKRARAEVYLRAHAAELPEREPTRQRTLRYLEGQGALSLTTSPPGAEAHLYRYHRVGRRLQPEPLGSLGPAPIVEAPLAMGSYLLRLHKEGFEDTLYPFVIEREGHWDARPPGSDAPTPVRLSPGAPGACYVPAGWFTAGGVEADAHGRRKVWVDAFLIQRHPVTNADYLAFLNALVERGEGERARALAPRQPGGIAGESGAMLYRQDGAGRFVLATDADGDRWELDWPVTMIDWHGAAAYAAWTAEETGEPWRLPAELEWEKAARGVDGRAYPWGEHLDPSWCCMRYSHPRGARPLPSVVSAFPVDESPYGVRGLAGNVMDWCLHAFRPRNPVPEGGRLSRIEAPRGDAVRVIRGGSWNSYARDCRAAARHRGSPSYRLNNLGFRLARSV